MSSEVVHDEVRVSGRMRVSVLGSDRVVFRLDHGPVTVRLVVRHDETGKGFPLVTGVECGEGLGEDLLAGYQWFGLDWLWLAMLDAVTG